MSTTVTAALGTAGVLGVTHAIEPDHVAGISSLTSGYGDSRLSALAGACFSLGHVALVVAWLVGASVLLKRTEFQAVYNAVGTLGVGIILGVLGGAMAIGGLRRVIRTDEHDHDDLTHSHPHFRVSLTGGDPDEHGHNTVAYLKTGLIGALFTFSPPISMIVFSATLVPDSTPTVVGLAVLTYAVTITATMSALGAGAGALFGLVKGRSATVYGAAQTVAGIVIGGFGVVLLSDAVTLLS